MTYNRRTWCLRVAAGVAAASVQKGQGQPATTARLAVDFGKRQYFPLVKAKASVFQEMEVSTTDAILRDSGQLRDLKVGYFRGLFNQSGPKWNTPPQIRKAEDRPAGTDRDTDRLLDELAQQRIIPMATIFRTPADFARPGENGSRRNDVLPPADLKAYAAAVEKWVSLHSARLPFAWEIWNEPDLKVFLDSPRPAEDYFDIYRHLAPAVRRAVPDHLIAGPVTTDGGAALFRDFLARYRAEAARTGRALPLDILTFHSYGRHWRSGGEPVDEDRLANIVRANRTALDGEFQTTPFVITEYEHAPAGGTDKITAIQLGRMKVLGATRFLSDLEFFLEQTDVEAVTWNRWQRTGPNGRPGGLLTHDGHRQAIYNAFQAYGMMPVDRSHAAFSGDAAGLHAFAASDDHNASTLLWNDSSQDRQVFVHWSRLPHAIASSGSIRLYRIDDKHASFSDSTEHEKLTVDETLHADQLRNGLHLTVPGPGIVFLTANDGTGKSQQERSGLKSARFVRTWRWCGRQKPSAAGGQTLSGDYGEFDWRAWTARTGTFGSRGRGITGVVLDNMPSKFAVRVSHDSIDWKTADPQALLGVRVDYEVGDQYCRSLLAHGPLFRKERTSELPWGKGGTTADVVLNAASSIRNGVPFSIDVEANAPDGWAASRRRALVSFWMENAGPTAQAVFELSE